MKRRGRSAPEPSLFDLPLAPGAAARPAPPPPSPPPDPQARPSLPLFAEAPAEASVEAPRLALVPEKSAAAATASVPEAVAAPVAERLLAGAADCLVHAAVATLLVAGTRLMGLPAHDGSRLPLLLFLLVFSFFYTVVPLAFWGQTLGMAWRGLEARAAGNQPLTFGQTARRWLGALATLGLAGLPLLWAVLSGRSLADRLSGSWTWSR